MTQVRINADIVSWLETNPVPNQPAVSVVASFGEVVDIPDDQVARLRTLTSRRFYTDPRTGVANGLARLEPVVVDAGETEAAEAEERTSIDTEVAELQARIAELQTRRPPAVSAAAAASALPVVLSPATTGTVLLPAGGTPSTAEEAAAAGMPAPLISAEARATALAEGRDAEASSTSTAEAPEASSTDDAPAGRRRSRS
jgi:hypothetical protein